MSLSSPGETGPFETKSETIGALIKREWNNFTPKDAELSQFKPDFIFDQDHPNPRNQTEMGAAIELFDANTATDVERTALGHGLIGVQEQIVFTIYAPSQKLRKQYEREVWRILRKFRPIAGQAFTRIKKKDNSSDSAIHEWDEIMPEWVAFDADVKGQERSNKSSAILTVISELLFIP